MKSRTLGPEAPSEVIQSASPTDPVDAGAGPLLQGAPHVRARLRALIPLPGNGHAMDWGVIGPESPAMVPELC